MKRIERKHLIFGILLFAVAFLISRAQFFASPTVELQNDTGEYMLWIDFYSAKGEMPPANYIPLGYPVIIKMLTLVKDSVYPIVYFQMVLTFFSFCILLFVVWRFYEKMIFYLSLLCLMIYVQVPNNLYYDIYILSESVYNSSLVLLVAALIYFMNLTNKKSSVFLSLALAAPILFRPTGVFALVIFLLLVAYLIFLNRKELLLSFVLPFLLFYFSLSLYSLIVSHDAMFLGQRVSAEVKTKNEKDSLDIKIERMSLSEKAITLYTNYASQSQVYARIQEANQKYFVKNFAHTNEFSCCQFEAIDSTKVKARKAIFKEFYDTDKMKYLLERENAVIKTKWFKVYDLLEMYFIKKIFLKTFWVLLMFASLFVSIALAISSKFRNTKALLLIFIIIVNIGTAATVIIGHHLPLPRYSYPAEFIFLLQLPFLIDLIREKIHAQ